MDRTFSVSVKGVLVAAVVLLGLLCACLLGRAGDGAQATSARSGDGAGNGAAEQSGGARTVKMAGTGKVTAVPDQVSFTVSVGVTRGDLSAALEQGNQTMQTVLKALRGFGVTKDDVATTGLSMHPVYDYPANEPPTLRGYRVAQKARVTVPDLAKAGKAITAAVEAGGNTARINDISLEVSDRGDVLGTARDAAVEDATTKAEQYAEATGQSLGEVITLREVKAAAPEREADRFADGKFSTSSLRAVPIRPGKEDLSVHVELEWQFK